MDLQRTLLRGALAIVGVFILLHHGSYFVLSLLTSLETACSGFDTVYTATTVYTAEPHACCVAVLTPFTNHWKTGLGKP